MNKAQLNPISVGRQLKLQNVSTDPQTNDIPSTPNPGICDNHTFNEYDDEDKIVDLELGNTAKTSFVQVGIETETATGSGTGSGTRSGSNLPTAKEGSIDIILTPNTSPILGSTVLIKKSSMTNISATTTSSILLEPSSGYISHNSPYSPYSPYSAGNDTGDSTRDVNNISVDESKLNKLQPVPTDTSMDDTEQESHDHENQ